MSEKRYVMKCDDESCYFCDTKEGKVIFVCQIVDILNSLVDENEQLRQQLQEMKSDEKLYAQEILELNKTKKEMLNFKQLSGDY